MRKNTKKGSYTLEAVIFLPLVLLAVLSLGYFMRVEGAWEQSVYSALNESGRSSLRAYSGSSAYTIRYDLEKRLAEDENGSDDVSVSRVRVMYADLYADSLTSYKLRAHKHMELPLGFGRDFSFDAGIRYRNFVGRKSGGQPMGHDALERAENDVEVWIFPHSGERYHGETCTYVKSSAYAVILDGKTDKKYRACRLCDAKEVGYGAIVYCFRTGDAYHTGDCSMVERRAVPVGKEDAREKGYTPCMKCGGE